MDEPSFEFDSGGHPIHPGGRWTLTLTGSGTLTLRHSAFGRQTAFGPFVLPTAEYDLLWQRIRALDLAHPPPDPQRPVPDEYCYGFLLRAGGTVQRMAVWAHIAQHYPPIQAFVAAVTPLIAHYTGQVPLIR
ncbi:MAG: hypothetical protein M3Z04_01830 [Chloroflexota bacterium]|nr:hypothetical protein [Chloroflexota bacterium]